ncbi:aspartate kinase, monofunctional class [Candidatus Acetothermia bacterium]|nr:aspartate kinase, monofunctional class [Candidatus Acetothermia bacterium]MBI3642535.1 aspartate kinase, monofunctional class [Candidatus Acetothermia bacterium]
MIVMKFGGTSVKDAGMMARVIEIVQSRIASKPLVVLSAMSGVTDALVCAAEEAHQGDEKRALETFEKDVIERHTLATRELIKDSKRRKILDDSLEKHFQEIRMLLKGLAILGELTPRSLDAVLSYGEHMSTLIMTAAMQERGLGAERVDARKILITDERFTQASPIMIICEERTKKTILPLIRQKKIPVTQGFIGSTESGLVTTLGRGGSDYSAAIFGALLEAEEIEIWTDVNGVMTADPRVVKDARTIDELSYEEAAELSYFGAKVLHSKTIRPAVEKSIPLKILNTFEPDNPGTKIFKDAAEDGRTIKAITFVKKLSQVNIEGRGMLGVPGVAAKVFTAVAHENINVLMISQSSSEQSICFVVEERSTDRAVKALNEIFERELERRNIDRIHAESGIVIITAVGMGVKDTPGIFGRVFGALGRCNVNVRSIAQGSSEHNLSIVVLEKDAEKAIREIHQEFELSRAP